MASGDVLTVKQTGNSIFMSTSGGNESWTTAVGTIEGGNFVVVTDDGQTLSGQATPITGIDIPSFNLSKVDPTIQWSDGSISPSNTDTLVNTRACGSPVGTLSLSDWTDFGPCVQQTDGTWSKARHRFCVENIGGNIELRCNEDCSGILPSGEAMSEIDTSACAAITPTDTNQWTDVTVNSPFLLSNLDSNGEVQIKYFPDILNKADAVTRCAEEGGIIMPIETQEDLDLVMTTAGICDDKPVWMPMTDSTTENSFILDVSSLIYCNLSRILDFQNFPKTVSTKQQILKIMIIIQYTLQPGLTWPTTPTGDDANDCAILHANAFDQADFKEQNCDLSYIGTNGAGDAIGVVCVRGRELDECTTGTAACHTSATCTDPDPTVLGNAVCTCPTGYDGDGKLIGTGCSDVDECLLGTASCDSNASCANIDGSFTCSCNSGFDGDGTTCNDLDECTLGTSSCSTNADCTNTVGSFSCACRTGFSGDGSICSDIDECNLSQNNNCDSNAICLNNEGSFTCSCFEGFDGTGVTCTDIDECTSGGDKAANCGDNQDCLNNVGSFACVDKTDTGVAGTTPATTTGILDTTTASTGDTGIGGVSGDPHIVVSNPGQPSVCFDIGGRNGEVINLLADFETGLEVHGRLDGPVTHAVRNNFRRFLINLVLGLPPKIEHGCCNNSRRGIHLLLPRSRHYQ